MPGIYHLRTVLIAFLLVSGVVPLFAREQDTRPPLALRLAGDAADGQFDQFSLLEAALIAGGLDSSDQVAKAVSVFESRFQVISKAVAGRQAGDRVQGLFDGLHQQFLHGDYRADYSELQRTLERGHFNCVTATILFRYLCERCKVESQVVASPNHVLCRVPEVSHQFIETTCPECHSTSSDLRGDHVPNPDEPWRTISDVALIGKVFYNRGVAALDAKRYSEAADLLVSARQFDPADVTARDNLLATLNNWALAACDDGQYETASRLIARGLEINAAYAPLQANDLHIHQQWVKQLCKAQQYGRAIDVLDEVIERHRNSRPFLEGRLGVYGKWAEQLFAKGEFAAAWSTLDQAKSQCRGESDLSAKYADVELATVLRASEKLIQASRKVEARSVIEAALARGQTAAVRQKLHLLQANL